LQRASHAATARSRRFWITFVVAIVLLEVAVHGGRGRMGPNTHMSAAARWLVVLGLVFLAARSHPLSLAWRAALVAGIVTDFAVGIILHFLAQNLPFARWAANTNSVKQTVLNYSEVTRMNFAAKLQHGILTLNDEVGGGAWIVLIGAALLTALWLQRTERQACRAKDADAESRI
jgi:hypothetical protein